MSGWLLSEVSSLIVTPEAFKTSARAITWLLSFPFGAGPIVKILITLYNVSLDKPTANKLLYTLFLKDYQDISNKSLTYLSMSWLSPVPMPLFSPILPKLENK